MILSMTGFGRGEQVLHGRDITVELRSVSGGEKTVYTYLGVEELSGGSLQPIYGRHLEAEIALTVFSPRHLGGQVCQNLARQVAERIAEQVNGVKLGAFRMEPCEFEEKSDCFQCRIVARAKAYLYARANGDETEFTDFILKGEVK